MSVLAVSLGAQTASIRLEGIVWNPSGEPLTGVILTAVEQQTGRQFQTVSDSDGYYRFLALQPGTYTVTAKAKEFKDVIHRNVVLFSPDTAIDNISFEVSTIDKEIPVSESVRLNDSTNSGYFSGNAAVAAPLLDRDPQSLFIYQPGVQLNGGDEGESTVNGMRKGMNKIWMDGLSISDPVSPGIGSSLLDTAPNSVDDIQIATLGAKAQYGGSGGGYFTMLSRSGTKAWGGNVYDYFRTENLNANDFFYNSASLPRPEITRHLFGGVVSGPIGNKTRIFGGYEGNRTDKTVTRNRVVLTPEAKAGVYRWFTPGDIVKDDATIRSFDIVANDPRGLGIDPQVASLLSMLPEEPNNTYIGDRLNTGGYVFSNPGNESHDRVTVRLDRTLNPNHEVFFRFNWQHANDTDFTNLADAPFVGGTEGTYNDNSWAVAGGWDWTIGPLMVNELRAGYLRPNIELKRPARTTDPMVTPNSFTNPMDTSFPSANKTAMLEIADNFTRSMNVHAFKFGGSYRRVLQQRDIFAGVYPDVTLGKLYGNRPPATIGPSELSEISSEDRQAFESLYNDLLGRMESVGETFNSQFGSTLPEGTPRTRNFGTNEFALFAQDDWKIRRNLTLNLGVRYEIYTAPSEKDGYQTTLDKASDISPAGQISNFTVVSGNAWYGTDWKSIAPRLGFAWDIRGKGDLVLRGSYGYYYDRLNGSITNFVDDNSYGFSQTTYRYPNLLGTDRRLSDGIALPAQPSPQDAAPPATRSTTIAVLDSNLRTPRVDQFNLTLEKKLFGSIFEVGYSGTRGKNLFQYTNLNQSKTEGDFLQSFKELQAYRDTGTPVPASNTIVKVFGTPDAAIAALNGYNFDTGQAGAAADEMDLNYYSRYAAAGVSDFYLRNYSQFNQFLYGSNTAESWFDSLQVGFRRSTAFYQVRVYYTWSKALDTISSDGNAYVSPSDSFHPELNKAYSDFDRTHVLNVSGNWALPYGRTKDSDSETSPWMDAILGGWNLGFLYIRESGQRFSVNSGRQNLYAGVSSLANYDGSRDIGNMYRKDGIIYWFSPDQAKLFSYPEAGEIASSGRNSFIGPDYNRLDVTVYKRFQVREGKYIQLRAEAFNVFNHTNFGNPSTNIYDSDFGTIRTTKGSPRSLQMALGFQF
jgi:hypothetical protein